MNIIVKNSNGKIAGNIIVSKDSIIIKNNRETYTIDDKELIKTIIYIYKDNYNIHETGNNSKEQYHIDKQLMLNLYNNYCLSFSEIAALVGISYWKCNKIMNSLELKISKNNGRKNPNYNILTSPEKAKKISENGKGKHSDNQPMKGKPLPEEYRKRISNTLKQKYNSGELQIDGSKISQAWKDGKYKNAKMGHGYQGWFTSLKFNNTFYFRSLLELAYILGWETNPCTIVSLISEPFSIPIYVNDKKRIYTPDFLINNKYLIEIKIYNHLKFNPNDKERFKQEILGANKYCKNNGLIYKIFTDKHISFDTNSFKRKLNTQIIEKFNITFSNKQLT